MYTYIYIYILVESSIFHYMSTKYPQTISHVFEYRPRDLGQVCGACYGLPQTHKLTIHVSRLDIINLLCVCLDIDLSDHEACCCK